MQRFLTSLVLVGGLVLLAGPKELNAQSKATVGGPTVELDGMKSQVFTFFKEGKPATPYLYAFTLPKELKSDKDSADLAIYPTSKGGDDAVTDFKTRMLPPKGYTMDQVARVEKFKVGAANVTKFMCQGTYLQTAKPDDSISEAKKIDDSRFLAYVIETPNKKFVVRLTGPFGTVGLHTPNMDTWVKAFK